MKDQHIKIRSAVKSDAATIHGFIMELALYEKEAQQVTATVEDIEQTLFEQDSTNTKTIICDYKGQPIGFCVYFTTYSTWLGRFGLYVEDLFVLEEFRGKGGGYALLKYVAREAVEKGCRRLEWSVLDWNALAIGFYESIGALAQPEWIRFRLADKELKDFAVG